VKDSEESATSKIPSTSTEPPAETLREYSLRKQREMIESIKQHGSKDLSLNFGIPERCGAELPERIYEAARGTGAVRGPVRAKDDRVSEEVRREGSSGSLAGRG
jgi:hypothetical protein